MNGRIQSHGANVDLTPTEAMILALQLMALAVAIRSREAPQVSPARLDHVTLHLRRDFSQVRPSQPGDVSMKVVLDDGDDGKFLTERLWG